MWKIWNDKVVVITDPFQDIGYPLPQTETADIALMSHDHFDHNNVNLINGDFQLIDRAGRFELDDVKIETFATWHDEAEGSKRGTNLLMKFVLEGRAFLHCGDLGHDLNDRMISELGKIDVLFIPVGGHFTIDAAEAKKIVEKLKPKIVFPMHYKTEVLDFPIAGKERYLDLVDNAKILDVNEIELTEEDFTAAKTIIMSYK